MKLQRIVPLALTISAFAFAQFSLADDWREPGRFGVLITQTSDGTQGGFAREADNYEVNLTFDASSSPSGPTRSNTLGMSGDLGTTLRLGWRTGLGEYNYLSAGVQGYRNFFSHDDGMNTNASYAVGPYIGIQRNFPHSAFMLTGWICPYYYDDISANNGSGGQQQTVTHHFFQNGGIGFGYLF